jgi:hypothetical protein
VTGLAILQIAANTPKREMKAKITIKKSSELSEEIPLKRWIKATQNIKTLMAQTNE